jgi:NAD(P)-dependent dehydrogenase (short-subunit alcohol dehydrogenase family)
VKVRDRYTGPTVCDVRAAIPAMRRNGGGSIVNIASIYGPVARVRARRPWFMAITAPLLA